MLQRCLLQELIHLFVHVSSRPIDGSVQLFDGVCGHLNQTVAWLAVLQGLDVIAVKRKTLQVRKLLRIGKHSEAQIVGKLSKPVEIQGKPKVLLRSSMDIDGSEQENLGWRAGR